MNPAGSVSGLLEETTPATAPPYRAGPPLPPPAAWQLRVTSTPGTARRRRRSGRAACPRRARRPGSRAVRARARRPATRSPGAAAPGHLLQRPPAFAHPRQRHVVGQGGRRARMPGPPGGHPGAGDPPGAEPGPPPVESGQELQLLQRPAPVVEAVGGGQHEAAAAAVDHGGAALHVLAGDRVVAGQDSGQPVGGEVGAVDGAYPRRSPPGVSRSSCGMVRCGRSATPPAGRTRASDMINRNTLSL